MVWLPPLTERQIVLLADDGIYYWQWKDELIEDTEELETIPYDPAMWKGPGWYRYNFDLTDDPRASVLDLVEFLGLTLSPELVPEP